MVKNFIKAVNETDLIGIFDCNYNNTLVTAKDVIDNIDYNVTIDDMLIFFEKLVAFYKEEESVAYFAGKAPVNITDMLLKGGYVSINANGHLNLEAISPWWIEHIQSIIFTDDTTKLDKESLENAKSTGSFKNCYNLIYVSNAIKHLKDKIYALYEAEAKGKEKDPSFSLSVPIYYYFYVLSAISEAVAKSYFLDKKYAECIGLCLGLGLQNEEVLKLVEIYEAEDSMSNDAAVTTSLLNSIARETEHFLSGPMKSLKGKMAYETFRDMYEKVLLTSNNYPILKEAAEGFAEANQKGLEAMQKGLRDGAGTMGRRVFVADRISFEEKEQAKRYYERIISKIESNKITLNSSAESFLMLAKTHLGISGVNTNQAKAPVYTSNSKSSTALNIPSPKVSERKPETKPQETPAKKVTPLSRVIHFIVSGVAAALLLFLLFSEKAGFIYLEENAIYSKIVLIVILTAIGTFLSEIRGFFYSLGVSVFIVLLIPYFVDYTIFIKILISLILGITAIYNLYRAFSGRGKKNKAK